ncbi:Rha family transcriptional regulator [Comamonas terrigena]|uniref:hypothetical protein n=1 Tax=Comamonas terrigena TaxID=32013 RepID=UPI00244B9EC6|nr:hypothetical protein [Comamonas terrigena]MDH1292768.1 Rha family transcriptional regulator [Comamonas terrigena]
MLFFFGKRHGNVLRATYVLLSENCSSDYPLTIEEPIMGFTNGKGGMQRGTVDCMTREGFMLLVMVLPANRRSRTPRTTRSAFNWPTA